jgi:hypothetical protein
MKADGGLLWEEVGDKWEWGERTEEGNGWVKMIKVHYIHA